MLVMKRALGLAVILSLVLLARPVRAQVCVYLDPSRDNLLPEERQAAVMVLGLALAKAGQSVVSTGCMGTWSVSNIRLGNTVMVTLVGPNGSTREGRVSKVDELPMIYDQMVQAIMFNRPMGETIDRNNAVNDQMVRRRQEADSVKYVRLGYGTITGGDFVSGPAFGFGWRFELDRFGIDVSLCNLMIATDSQTRSESSGLTGSWFKLAFLVYQSPISDYSMYYGLGLGLGGTVASYGNDTYSGSGLQGEPFIGGELFRSSTMRLFFQLDGTFPFYKLGDRYAPSVILSVGVGWGKSNTIGVVSR
jgi:hypothetical protein